MMNYYAIGLAGLLSMVLGFLYYHPKAFGSKWMELAGIKKQNKEGMGGRALLGFIAEFVKVYVLAMFIGYAGATTFSASLAVGFFTWVGFTATVTLGSFLWERKSFNLWILNNFYNLLSILLIVSILTVF